MITANIYSGRRATTITRSLVLRYLRDSDDDGDDTDSELNHSLGSATSSQSVPCGVEDGNDTGEDVLPASLQQIKAWLDNECKIEQARVEPTAEYEHSSMTREEAHLGSVQGPDTSILHRIRKKYGPRPSQFEDLLFPLRIGDSEQISRFGKRPRKETSQALEEALRKWNRHITSSRDNLQARESLMEALQDRIAFLDGTVSHRRSADAHEDSLRRLLHAIHAYRPETAAFETKDPIDILILILAHIGFAVPDIDNELKYSVFYTLITERGRMAHAANAGTKRQIDEKIAEVKRQGCVDEIEKYEKRAREWAYAVFRKNCDTITDRVKTARRNIQAKSTQDLSSLVVLQAAQKAALEDKISNHSIRPIGRASRALLLADRGAACTAASTELRCLASTTLSALESSLAFAAQNTAAMERTSRVRILARALKFAGLDLKNVSDFRRRQVIAERMANQVGTGLMMGSAAEALEEVRINARATVEVMGSVEVMLEEVEEAAEAACEEYEAMLRLVEGGLGGIVDLREGDEELEVCKPRGDGDMERE
jgi:hypothetical protein